MAWGRLNSFGHHAVQDLINFKAKGGIIRNDNFIVIKTFFEL